MNPSYLNKKKLLRLGNGRETSGLKETYVSCLSEMRHELCTQASEALKNKDDESLHRLNTNPSTVSSFRLHVKSSFEQFEQITSKLLLEVLQTHRAMIQLAIFQYMFG